jgi:hypothetical protein
MNNRTLARARDSAYVGLARAVIGAITRWFGQPVTPATIEAARVATQPIIATTRGVVRDLVYRDYVQVIGGTDPVDRLELHRFTDELWQSSIEKAVEGHDVFDTSSIEQIGLSADYWTRDAEWGQAVDAAKKDSRVGRIARVDPIPPTCPLCTLMNSRGPVYVSEESFARTLHTGDTCEPVFVPAGVTDYPGKDQTDVARERYKRAVEAVPNGSANAILQALKDQEPNRPAGRTRRRIVAEVHNARESELKQIRARIAALESINPTTQSAIKYKREQLVRNQKLLSDLESR